LRTAQQASFLPNTVRNATDSSEVANPRTIHG
jgi:hypothetical protein